MTIAKVQFSAASVKDQLSYKGTVITSFGRGPKGGIATIGKIDFTSQPRALAPR